MHPQCPPSSCCNLRFSSTQAKGSGPLALLPPPVALHGPSIPHPLRSGPHGLHFSELFGFGNTCTEFLVASSPSENLKPQRLLYLLVSSQCFAGLDLGLHCSELGHCRPVSGGHRAAAVLSMVKLTLAQIRSGSGGQRCPDDIPGQQKDRSLPTKEHLGYTLATSIGGDPAKDCDVPHSCPHRAPAADSSSTTPLQPSTPKTIVKRKVT